MEYLVAMKPHWVVLTAYAVLAGQAFSATPVAELEARYQRAISTAEGQAYEMKAVQAFWGNAQFMRECAPPNAPVTAPLNIYVGIEPTGSISDYVIVPNSAVATCIEKHTRHRVFPPPPSDYTLKIELKFTK